VLGLHTILSLPILYGVWHTKGRSRGGRILPNSRAIVLQQCGQCRRAGRKKGRLTRAQTTGSKTLPCEVQISARTLVGILRILHVRYGAMVLFSCCGFGVVCHIGGAQRSGVNPMLNTRNEKKNTVFVSYVACFVNTFTLNMYVFMSYTGLIRRNT